MISVVHHFATVVSSKIKKIVCVCVGGGGGGGGGEGEGEWEEGM